MRIIAIIPARSGSKRLMHKNILPYKGKPLLVHSIEQAKSVDLINEVIVTTDSPEYAKLAMRCSTVNRPKELAGDLVSDLMVFQHVLDIIGFADIVVHLRPTYPTRTIGNIEEALNLLIKNELADSVRSVACAKENPYKMWHKKGVYLEPIVGRLQSEPDLDVTNYYQNACVDVIRGNIIINGSMTGKYILPYLMNNNEDINTYEDYTNLLERTSNG